MRLRHHCGTRQGAPQPVISQPCHLHTCQMVSGWHTNVHVGSLHHTLLLPRPQVHPIARPGRQRRPCLASAAAATAEEQAPDAEVEDDIPGPLSSVVRIKIVQDLPRFDFPLLLGSVRSLTRCAVAVTHNDQQYLLTTATNVAYSTQIRVYLPGQDTPYKAHVAHLSMEADLAVLEVASTSEARSTGSSPMRASRRRAARRASSAPASSATAIPPGGVGGEPEGEEASKQDRSGKGRDGSSGPRGARGTTEDTVPSEFWDMVEPLPLQLKLPGLQEGVAILGPSSDEGALSNTSPARVACVEVHTYPAASYRLLALALTGATAGKEPLGRAVVDTNGHCCGLVFQRSRGSAARRRGASGTRRGGGQDMLHAVPGPVIAHVLDAVHTHGTYMGFPQLGIKYRHCDSPALRAYLQLAPEQQGVLVLDVNPTSSVAGTLLPGDVIMTLAGQHVGSDGTLPFEFGGRIAITHAVAQHPVGSELPVTVLRNGQPMELRLMLGVPHRLLPTHLGGAPPSYLVIGGLVLTPLSVPFLEQCFGPGGKWMRAAPPQLISVITSQPQHSDEQAVVIAHAEVCTCLDGYKPDGLEHKRVTGVAVVPAAQRGKTTQVPELTPVRNLRHLAGAVLGVREGDIWLRLDDKSIVIVDAAQARADCQIILDEFEVRHAVSKDMSDLLPQSSRSRPALNR